MGDRSGDASALLGMEDFVVLSPSEEDGETWAFVETTATVAGCPNRGVKATGARAQRRPRPSMAWRRPWGLMPAR